MRQLTRDCLLSLQGGWDGNKTSKLLSQKFPPINLKKLRQELLTGMALPSHVGTKSARPRGLGEILTTLPLGRAMSQTLPLGHTQPDPGKGHQEKRLAPPMASLSTTW